MSTQMESGDQGQGVPTSVSIQSPVEVKDRLQIRSLPARQCLAEFLAVSVLMVGGLIEAEERGSCAPPRVLTSSSGCTRKTTPPAASFSCSCSSCLSYLPNFIPVTFHLLPSFASLTLPLFLPSFLFPLSVFSC